jgi:hypothetical protein
MARHLSRFVYSPISFSSEIRENLPLAVAGSAAGDFAPASGWPWPFVVVCIVLDYPSERLDCCDFKRTQAAWVQTADKLTSVPGPTILRCQRLAHFGGGLFRELWLKARVFGSMLSNPR